MNTIPKEIKQLVFQKKEDEPLNDDEQASWDDYLDNEKELEKELNAPRDHHYVPGWEKFKIVLNQSKYLQLNPLFNGIKPLLVITLLCYSNLAFTQYQTRPNGQNDAEEFFRRLSLARVPVIIADGFERANELKNQYRDYIVLYQVGADELKNKAYKTKAYTIAKAYLAQAIKGNYHNIAVLIELPGIFGGKETKRFPVDDLINDNK